MMRPLATANFYLQMPEGTRKPMRVSVGRPTKRRTGAWACEVEVTDIVRRTAIYGDDSLQALCLALGFVDAELYGAARRGIRVVDKAGRSVPLTAYFRAGERTRRSVRKAYDRAPGA